MKKITPILITVSAILILSIFIINTVNKPQSTLSEKDTTTVITPTKQISEYTLAEVSQHNSKTDCWMIVNNSVVDVTKFIASGEHNPEIIRGCGLDATSMFEAERKHSKGEAQSLLQKYTIGTLKP